MKITSTKILGWGFVLVVGMWAGWASLGSSQDVAEWGQIGDKFGALNTLFTGLASIGVVAALWHEREGAADREREHKELLAAMKAQAEASLRNVQITAMIQTIRRVETLLNKNPDPSDPKIIAVNEEASKVRDALYNRLTELCADLKY